MKDQQILVPHIISNTLLEICSPAMTNKETPLEKLKTS
jgi:hypothetical protein